jgi:hypothetical protein
VIGAGLAQSIQWLGYGLNHHENGARFGKDSSLFFVAFTQLWGPSQSPMQWLPGGSSSGGKTAGPEADHWPSTSAEVVKNTWIYISTPHIFSWHSA